MLFSLPSPIQKKEKKYFLSGSHMFPLLQLFYSFSSTNGSRVLQLLETEFQLMNRSKCEGLPAQYMTKRELLIFSKPQFSSIKNGDNFCLRFAIGNKLNNVPGI